MSNLRPWALLSLLVVVSSSSAQGGDWRTWFGNWKWRPSEHCSKGNGVVPGDVFGPVTFSAPSPGRESPAQLRGEANAADKIFPASDTCVSYAFRIENHGANRAEILLNGRDIGDPDRFRSDTAVTLVPVKLQLLNSLHVDIQGPNDSSVTITIYTQLSAAELPPNPATLAPAIAPGSAPTLAGQTSFLYTGANPIQTGVSASTIVPTRAAVIRGKVVSSVDASALSGVAVSVVGHPEYGQTLTQATGAFDLAVNGGGVLTLSFSAPNVINAQRQVTVPLQNYVVAPTVALVALDSAVTPITLGSAQTTLQAARGNTVTDSSGTRRATVLFPAGTTGKMVLPSGATQTLGQISVRATEVTVGPNGPMAMPAALPHSTAYTYAVELTADEELATGAQTIEFNQTVPFYVENFLNFPVGMAVPSGYYNRTESQWVAQPNGLVIKVLSVSHGVAALDVAGQGTAASAAALAALGIGTPELTELGSLYTPGTSVWRTPLTHFTVVDNNMGGTTGENGPPPTQGTTGDGPQPPTTPVTACGSIIQAANQVLREQVPVAGTPFTLNYASNRSVNRTSAYTLNIPLFTPPLTNTSEIDLEVVVAGQSFTYTFAPPSGTVFPFTWNGLDAYGRQLFTTQDALIELYYIASSGAYAMPFTGGPGFGVDFAVPTTTGVPFRSAPSAEFGYTVPIGAYDSRQAGLGGWTLSAQNAYDPVSQTLYFGDGSSQRPAVTDTDVSIFLTGLSEQTPLALGADGSLYFVNSGIEVRSPSGAITPLNSAQASGLALSPTGNLYFTQSGAGLPSTVSMLSPSGAVTVLAGGGTLSDLTTMVPGTEAALAPPGAIALAADGTLFFLTSDNVLHRLGTDGNLIAYPGASAFFSSDVPLSLASAPDGSLYVGTQAGHLWQFAPNQAPVDTAGNLIPESSPQPIGEVAADSNGNVVFGTISGSLYHLSGGAAVLVPLFNPLSQLHDLAFGPDGSLYASQLSGQVLKIAPAYPTLGGMAFTIASSDASQLYDFDISGRHLDTRDALTGAIRYSFSYTAAGFLNSVTDVTGNVTTITRDSSGNPSAITSPYGVVTSLASTQGFLSSISDPLGETFSFEYLSGTGLLSQFTKPSGATSRVAYDNQGRLATDQDALGGIQYLINTTALPVVSNDVSYSDASGIGTQFSYQSQPLGSTQETHYADGTVSEVVSSITGQVSSQAPNGTKQTQTLQLDPRFGRQAAYAAFSQTVIPGGQTYTVNTNRSVVTPNPAEPSAFQLIETDNLNGNTTTTTFDSSALSTTSVSPVGRVSSTLYDSFGRVAQVKAPGLTPVSIAYDSRGRLSSEVQGARQTQFSYDAMGNLQATTDALGETTSFLRDGVGRVTTETLPDGRQIHFTFDADGNQTSVSPPGRPAYGFTFNLLDLLTLGSEPLSPVTSYQYTPNRSIASITRPDGSQIVNSYDPTTGKLDSVTTPAGVSSYQYNATTGLLSQLTSPTSTHETESLALIYNGPYLVHSSWSGEITGTVSTSRNNDFNPLQEIVSMTPMTNPGDFVPFVINYDADLLPSSCTVGGGGGTQTTTLVRDPASGLVTSNQFQGGGDSSSGGVPALGTFQTNSSYDSFGELITQTTGGPTGPLMNQVITRDSLGRITGDSQTVLGTTSVYEYSYDVSGRLTNVTLNGLPFSQYVYDSNSNRLSQTTSAGTVTSSYDSGDKLLSSGSFTYTYTPNGEMASKTDSSSGAVTQYQYDNFGNLITVILPTGSTINYILDGTGRRVGRKVNGALTDGYLYGNGPNPMGHLDSSGIIRQWFGYCSQPGLPDAMAQFEGPETQTMLGSSLDTTLDIVKDERGSPRLIIDGPTGTIQEQINYDEFGNVTLDTNPGYQPFGFAGCLYDQDTKLCHFGAREYDPSTGRWLQRDPVGFGGGQTNLYGYVLNDPVNHVDPNGTGPILYFACVAAFGGGLGIAESALNKYVAGEIAAQRAIIKKAQSCGDTKAVDAAEKQINSLNALRLTTASTLLAEGLDVGVVACDAALVAGPI